MNHSRQNALFSTLEVQDPAVSRRARTKAFFLVFARDGRHVDDKIRELRSLGVPYLIVCGEDIHRPNVAFREPKGKYDAINFGVTLVPNDTEIVVLNDVDTKIRNLDAAFRSFCADDVAIVFTRVSVKEGPQQLFYGILDRIRSRLLVAASGELMLVKYDVLSKLVPLEPCKAEDSYLLFKVLEFGRKCVFCSECYSETERTKSAKEEENYKRRTVCGIYQALAYARPPAMIRVFYTLLPLFSPLLLFSGRKGYSWMAGILRGFVDYLTGDKSGVWQETSMKLKGYQ